LDEEQQRQVQELKAIDARVRRHEQAHLAAAGSYAKGAPAYEYQTGPDHRRYAVGGEVSLDTRPVPNDPAATLRKAEIIRGAALAPADPSSQDRRVAAQASQMEMKARQELARQQADAVSGYNRQGQAVSFTSQPPQLNVTA
jgi:hypothetical protein